MPTSDVLAGLFTGGRSSRMGRAKGLLEHPSGATLIEHWQTLFVSQGLSWRLVGDTPEYRPLGLPTLVDTPPGVGPLGGLAALLSQRPFTHVVALAVDMPFVTAPLLSRLLSARNEAAIVAARRDDRWEPFFAVMEAAKVAPLVRDQLERGEHSLQRLFDLAGAQALSLSDEESAALRDWDTPADVERDREQERGSRTRKR